MKICSIEDCSKKVFCNGHCRKHYMEKRARNAPPCIVTDCNLPQFSKKLCRKHYNRQWENGTTELLILPRGTALAWINDAIRTESNDCMEFPYSRNEQGYGYLNYQGKHSSAHRLALRLHTGRNPQGMFACHKPGICHNPACCNPRHLYWGTPRQNSADQLVDGTKPRGQDHRNSKLTDDQARAIKLDKRERKLVAAAHGVSVATVKSIRAGRNWGWLQ